MTAPGWQVAVIAKEPVPGAVKTRLCPPLHPGFAGLATRAPRGANSSSARSASKLTSRLVLAHSIGIPAANRGAMPASRATVPRTAGVPARKRAMPATGSYAAPIANWSCWPHQPQIGWRSNDCSSGRT